MWLQQSWDAAAALVVVFFASGRVKVQNSKFIIRVEIVSQCEGNH